MPTSGEGDAGQIFIQCFSNCEFSLKQSEGEIYLFHGTWGDLDKYGNRKVVCPKITFHKAKRFFAIWRDSSHLAQEKSFVSWEGGRGADKYGTQKGICQQKHFPSSNIFYSNIVIQNSSCKGEIHVSRGGGTLVTQNLQSSLPIM